MSSTKKLPLRILYTINSSPQYILARSHAAYPVIVLPPNLRPGKTNVQEDELQHIYASTALKNCLHTICLSSPELVQESTRDFSVYVLDPLESNSAPAPVNISNPASRLSASQDALSEQTLGVAVGFGLMSLALQASSDESVNAVGTMVTTGGQESLEVVFALRETLPKSYPPWNPRTNISQQTVNSTDVAFQNRLKGLDVGSPALNPSTAGVQQHNHTQHLSFLSSLKGNNCLASTSTSKIAESKSKSKKPRPSNVPITGSDKLLDAPEVYIGPFKKKGRPKNAKNATVSLDEWNAASGLNSNKAEEPILFDVSDDSDVNEQTATLDGCRKATATHRERRKSSTTTKSKTKKNIIPNTTPFSTTPLIRPPFPTDPQVKTEPQEEPNVLDILRILTSSNSGMQNAAVLAALSTIDANPGVNNAENPALIGAIKQLVSMCSNSTHSNHPSSSSSNPTHSTSNAPPEDDIIILDKENVNPAVFKRRAQREYEEAKLNGASSNPLAPAFISSQINRPSPNLALSSRSNGSSPPKGTPAIDAGLSGGNARVSNRKRTLSDILDERESGKNREKTRDREKRDVRHPTLYRKTSTADSLRHYSRLLDTHPPKSDNPASYYRTGMEPWTSPPRSKKEDVTHKPNPYYADSEMREHQFVVMRSPRRERTAASSPIRSNSTMVQARKKYVVPAWARTNTATQPRLSEEAQQALEEAEDRKRLEKVEGKRKANVSQETTKRKKKRQARHSSNPSSSSNHEGHVNTSTSASISFQKSVPQKTDYPLIAATIKSPFGVSFLSNPRCISPIPSSSRIPFPKTPTREKHTTRLPSGGECDALFTPVRGSASLVESARTPLFTPQVGYCPFDSPLNRKKVKMTTVTPVTPVKSNFKETGSEFLFGRLSQTSNSSKHRQKSLERDAEVELDKELDEALDDLERPPSSLPVASNDIEINETPKDQNVMEAERNEESDDSRQYEDMHPPTRQLWAGLPPSSPPPPSSPLIAPVRPSDTNDDEDMDDQELPIATSDVEADTTDLDTDFSFNDDSQFFSEDDIATCLAGGDFSSFFAMNHQSDEEIPRSDDIFEQFTNLNAQSDDMIAEGVTEMNMSLGDKLDLTAFWETFNPLLQGHVNVRQSEGIGFDFGDISIGGELDHEGLAEDVKALLSGCLM